MNKEQRDSNKKGVSRPTFFGDSGRSANHWQVPLKLIAMVGTLCVIEGETRAYPGMDTTTPSIISATR